VTRHVIVAQHYVTILLVIILSGGKKHTTPLESIEKFLDLIDGYRPKYWIRLSGGETTLCGPEYLEELCEIVHQHGRNISLLTNGARMLDCDPHWFEFIHLDEHIVNHDLIQDIRKDFKKKRFNRYQLWVTKEHRDLDLQRKDHITEGLQCSDHMDAITLWRDTVFPCCVSPFLDGWNGNTKVREAQIKAGWTIENNDLVKLLEEQERGVNSLLGDTVSACKTQCWKGGLNLKFQPVS